MSAGQQCPYEYQHAATFVYTVYLPVHLIIVFSEPYFIPFVSTGNILNVLSLPANIPGIDSKKQVFGDIVLCNIIIEQEAKEQNKSLSAHLAHLVVHGVLHLIGLDHKIDSEAEIMENTEIKILKSYKYQQIMYMMDKNHHFILIQKQIHYKIMVFQNLQQKKE